MPQKTSSHLLNSLAVCVCDSRDFGPENMAIDEALFRLATQPVLRIYRWPREEISFGYPMRWAEVEPLAHGRPAVRRWTGGGLVEHGSDLTVSLSVPASEPLARLRPADSYRAIHETIAAALSPRHREVRLAAECDCTKGAACFQNPARFDILIENRKVAGGSQRRSRHGLLYQGSIQQIEVDDDFPQRLAIALAPSAEIWKPTAAIGRLARALTTSRYATDAWTHKR